jgi:hypothetical protein
MKLIQTVGFKINSLESFINFIQVISRLGMHLIHQTAVSTVFQNITMELALIESMFFVQLCLSWLRSYLEGIQQNNQTMQVLENYEKLLSDDENLNYRPDTGNLLSGSTAYSIVLLISQLMELENNIRELKETTVVFIR